MGEYGNKIIVFSIIIYVVKTLEVQAISQYITLKTHTGFCFVLDVCTYSQKVTSSQTSNMKTEREITAHSISSY